jgi:hypothetical protein
MVAALSVVMRGTAVESGNKGVMVRWEDDALGEDRHVVGYSGVIDHPLDGDDAEDSDNEPPRELPDGATVVVYVPSDRIEGGVKPDTKLHLRYLEDGQLVLPMFSSLDQLITNCGEGQPWVAIPAEQVEDFRHIVGADLAVLDPEIPAEQEHSNVTEGTVYGER